MRAQRKLNDVKNQFEAVGRDKAPAYRQIGGRKESEPTSAG